MPHQILSEAVEVAVQVAGDILLDPNITSSRPRKKGRTVAVSVAAVAVSGALTAWIFWG